MRRGSSEVVETMPRRGTDLCYIQEVCWRVASSRVITGKENRRIFLSW